MIPSASKHFYPDATTPYFNIVDTYDYAGDGISLSNVVSVIKATDPSGLVFYNNTNFASPDINADVSLTSGNIDLPLDENGEVMQGTYTIEHTVRVSGSTGAGDFTSTYTVNYTFEKPIVSIDIEVSTQLRSFLTSVDETDYTYNGVTPTQTRTHRVYHPRGIFPDASSIYSHNALTRTFVITGDVQKYIEYTGYFKIVNNATYEGFYTIESYTYDDITDRTTVVVNESFSQYTGTALGQVIWGVMESSAAEITIYDIWTRTFTSYVSTYLIYELAEDFFVYVTATGQEEVDVVWEDLNAVVYDYVNNVVSRWENSVTNASKYAEMTKLVQKILAHFQLYEMAKENGDEVAMNTQAAIIKELLDSNVVVYNVTNDTSPVWIVFDPDSTPGKKFSTGSNYASNRIFTGSAEPSSSLGTFNDLYFRRNGDVYQKRGNVWTIVMNIQGPQSGSGWEYSDTTTSTPDQVGVLSKIKEYIIDTNTLADDGDMLLFSAVVTYDASTAPGVGVSIGQDSVSPPLEEFEHTLTDIFGFAEIEGTIKRTSATTITAVFKVTEFTENAGVYTAEPSVYAVDSRMAITLADLENNPFSIFLKGNCDSVDMTGKSEIIYVPKK